MPRKHAPASAEVAQNAAKTLYANIRFASVDAPVKSIVLTSSVPNEGKTTLAHHLAVAIASSGKRVLLVECDDILNGNRTSGALQCLIDTFGYFLRTLNIIIHFCHLPTVNRNQLSYYYSILNTAASMNLHTNIQRPHCTESPPKYPIQSRQTIAI